MPEEEIEREVSQTAQAKPGDEKGKIPPGTRCERLKKGRQCTKSIGHVGPHDYTEQPPPPPEVQKAMDTMVTANCVSCHTPLKEIRKLGMPGGHLICNNPSCYRYGLVTLAAIGKAVEPPAEQPPEPPIPPERLVNLCDTCTESFGACKPDQMEFGDGPGGDNVIKCDAHKPREG